MRRFRNSRVAKPTLTRDQLRIICDRRRKQVRRTSDDAPFRDVRVLEAQRTKDEDGVVVAGPLAGMDWSGEDFTNCDLRGADLSHCCFDGADFRDADLWDADLRESDLRGARHLRPAQLAATDLVGAQLPESLAEFDTLKTVEALSVSSAKVFFTLLLAVVYVVLTAGTVRDAQLLTGAQSLKLPVIDVTISGSYFFIIAPLLLLCLFVYFHLYLQRLWEALSQLPARFPDGRRLDERTHPWLMNDLARQHIPLLARMGIPLAFLQAFLSISIGYLLIPVAIGQLWHRYLPMQHSSIAVFQMALFGLAVAGAAYFGRLKYDALAKKPLRRSWLAHVIRVAGAWCGAPVGVLAAAGIGFVTLGVLETGANAGEPAPHATEQKLLIGSNTIVDPIMRPDGPLPWWKPESLVAAAVSVARWLPVRDRAEVVAEDVSIKPFSWTGVETRRAEEMGQVRSVVFSGTRLCRLQAQGSFLAKAVFDRGADLRWAEMSLADLRGAVFQSVTADEAWLTAANLNDETKLPESVRESFHLPQGYPARIFQSSFRRANFLSAHAAFMEAWTTDFTDANFSNAHCIHARFIDCELAGANFANAECQWVTFSARNSHFAVGFLRSNLKGADFTRARLDWADLSGVDLSGAKGLTVEQLRSAKTIYRAKLDPPLANELAKELETPPPKGDAAGTNP